MHLSGLTVVLTVSILTARVISICSPDHHYGIGGFYDENRWTAYDMNCNPVDVVNGNPCNQPSGIFDCSKPPLIQFTAYKNTKSGIRYSCSAYPKAGSCGGDHITVCC
ncbi:hypothetical protein PM082_010080 [Marasmius tenuissimus]|nr:hypothetical protein PM082_010080 [Marasmius tenuissimus]